MKSRKPQTIAREERATRPAAIDTRLQPLAAASTREERLHRMEEILGRVEAPPLTRGITALAGARIDHAFIADGQVYLNLITAHGADVVVTVMRDPEGNGPGSLHLFAGERCLGIVGGGR